MDEAKQKRLEQLVNLASKAADLRDLDKVRGDIPHHAARIASSWNRTDAVDLLTDKLLEALDALEADATAEIEAMVATVTVKAEA